MPVSLSRPFPRSLLIAHAHQTSYKLLFSAPELRHPENPAALIDLIDLLLEMLDGNPELKRTFAIWIHAVLLRQSKYTLVLHKVQDLKELKMTLAKRFDAWAQQHEQKGIEKGESILLQRLLARRFGPLPAEALTRTATASAAELELWGDRVLDATSLEDVLRA